MTARSTRGEGALPQLIVPSQGFPLGPAALPGEARTLATLGHVPAIVHVHQAGELIVDVGSNPILVECLGHWRPSHAGITVNCRAGLGASGDWVRTAGIGLGLIAAAVLAGGPGLTPACAQVRDGVAATALAASAIYQVNATAFDLNSRIIATAQDLFQTLIQLPRSCPVFAGSGSLLTEDTCVWVRVTAEAGAWSSTTRHAIDWQAGGQFEVAPGWLLGASVETGGSSSLMPDGRSSAGRSFSAALVAKRIERQLLLSGSLAIFSATDQNAWQVRGPNSTTTSSVNAFGAGLMLRGAYQFPLDPVYLRPILEVAVGFTSQSGLQEAGPAAALTVDPGSKVSTQIAPALEVGGRVDCGSVILRPYVVAGPIFLPDNSRQLSGTLGGAPFSGTVYGKNVLAHVEAGLQVYQSKSWEAKLEYRLIAADQLLDHVLSLRTAKHF